MEIKIIVKDKYFIEKQYIINTIFVDFLGIPVRVEKDKSVQNYLIETDSEVRIELKDSFFNKPDNAKSYLHKGAISQGVKHATNKFTVCDKLPVLYGEPEVYVKQYDDRTKYIYCGVDIFAASFFMLTRWEEYVIKTRDTYNRFPVEASLAYKNHFLHRPIVNEYVEMLWNMLKYLIPGIQRKQRKSRPVLTHDVDDLYFWNTTAQAAKRIVGDVVKRKSIKLSGKHLSDYVKFRRKKIPDPYDTFDFLMDLSESVNTQSRFYFMTSRFSTFDATYFIEKAIPLIKHIKSRGHVVGLHGSYHAAYDSKRLAGEKQKLEEVSQIQITEGRQHFLRFAVPDTWQVWHNAGLKTDSTLGYATQEGFRCGVCYEFRVFDVVNRKALPFVERPLLSMDVTYTTYNRLLANEIVERNNALIQTVCKYHGDFVLLWHNSSFNEDVWADLVGVYQEIVKKIICSNCL